MSRGQTFLLKALLLADEISQEFLVGQRLLAPAFDLRFLQACDGANFLDFRDDVRELFLLRNAVLVSFFVPGVDRPSEMLLLVRATHVERAAVEVILRNVTQHVEFRVFLVLFLALSA